ncbi:acyltransferase [Bradyrhizobium sp. 40]|uniref:acyltransferase family protein n=1 Tax=Bradyrhizobium sp. 40 TaxID=2782674 RepID=UPI001FFF49B8|nr:acyltransferase [Bradyrhizobium sp. 40]UPJ43947.1 acyltransferase [Bradyrhizobium sp. 40]
MVLPNYLPNLNGLRAVSVLVVIMQHATALQYEFAGYYNPEWLWISGKFGVVMFFCISGFLITYLLDREVQATGAVDVRQFYVKRIARIWPIYFLVVIPALILNQLVRSASFYQPMTLTDYVLILLVLPGYADRPLFIGQTWSIAIEESFYLLYPLMVRGLGKPALIVTLLAVAFSPEILSLTAPLTCHLAPCEKLAHDYYWAPGFYGTIAIGCLTYLIYSLKIETLNRVLFSPMLQCAAAAAVGVVITAAILSGKEQYFDFRWDAIAFSIVVLNVSLNKNSIIQIENRITRFLGEISYGMYMYHVYCICLVLLVCMIFFKGETFPRQHLIVCGFSFLLTVAVSKFSFDRFETPIRNWARSRFRPRSAAGIFPVDRAMQGRLDPAIAASQGLDRGIETADRLR